MVLLDAQFVHIIVAVQNSKPKPSRLIRVLLCHNLYIIHFPVLLYHVQDVLFCSFWGESAQKYFLCSLVGLRVLFLTGDCTLAFHLTSDKGRKKKKIIKVLILNTKVQKIDMVQYYTYNSLLKCSKLV